MNMKLNPKASRASTGIATLRLVLLSDTHELHREVDVPAGDILIHAGDFTMFGRAKADITDFLDWLKGLPQRHKILIPGNHEFLLEANLSGRFALGDAQVLINEGIEIEGLRIWGSPVTPLLGGAFGLSVPEDREEIYAQIPKDIDVLVSHGPPFGILDSDPASGLHSGCRQLLDAVTRVKPELHIFGHIHGAYGVFPTEHTTFVNASLVGDDGGLENAPFVFEMGRK
jgi:predicted phosphohydrolase